jgi:hypothetical protein
MCFVRISEQTAVITLYSINWLVFITEKGCVYCAVRAEFVYKIRVRFSVYNLKRVLCNTKPLIKDKVYPKTGHEGPEGGTGISLLFL